MSATRPGAAYYVVAGTRGRRPVFADARSCVILIAGLGYYKQVLDFRLHAFAVLPAEMHLLVRPLSAEGDLPTILKNVKGKFAGKHNRMNGTSGPVWRRGFYDEEVRSHAAIERRIQEVHALPVREGLVRSPQDYEYSSLRWYRGEPPNYLVDTEW
ncbi:MAG: hypothetical protein L0216_15795 [Planctomycetales bacterium]|nr:hypothetical protein [Planctomycetales bacterium]